MILYVSIIRPILTDGCEAFTTTTITEWSQRTLKKKSTALCLTLIPEVDEEIQY